MINKYGNEAIEALGKDISPDLIRQLDELGIQPKDYADNSITSKETAERVIKEVSDSKILNDVANKYDTHKYNFSEAKNPISATEYASNYPKYELIEQKMYTDIRAFTDDVEKISNNLNWSKKDVNTIKNHLFYDKVLKDNGVYEVMDTDLEIGYAWNRLIKGEYYERDILLLNHELYEAIYMQIYKECTLRNAHEAATQLFDWASLISYLMEL